MLNGKEERAVDAHLDGFGLIEMGGGSHHHDGGCGGGLRAFLIDLNEGLVKNIGYIEIVVGTSRRDRVEIGASLGNIEGALHAKGFQRLSQSEESRLQIKLWQVEDDLFTFQTGTIHQQLGG